MKKSWGEQMVFRGNEVGISRHLQSIWVGGGVLWKIDCYLTVNQGGDYKNIPKPQGGIS